MRFEIILFFSDASAPLSGDRQDSTPDCRVPRMVQNHVAQGSVATFNALIGFYEEVLQTAGIVVCVEHPPAQ